jgi:cysteine desulfurase
MQTPVYIDNSATTPVDPRVIDAMMPWLTTHFGNPASSTHEFGREAARAVARAREQAANIVGATAPEIIWTSGATESNNLAIKGAAEARKARGQHLVTVATEHKAVLDAMSQLKRAGWKITLLQPDASGLITTDQFEAALQPDTVLASVMLVNNEIGVIQDVAALGAICRARDILFHVDAAQATGKVDIDVRRMNVDLMSLTAHKTYGPKGVGALYVRNDPKVRITAQLHGGGHERGMRSGTLATHQIVGMGECLRIAGEEMATELPRLRAWRDRIWQAIREVPGVQLNGDYERRIANNLNVSLTFPVAEGFMNALSGVAISSTSACSSGAAMPSHVLTAIGAPTENVMRITVGRMNTDEEITWAAGYLRESLLKLQQG